MRRPTYPSVRSSAKGFVLIEVLVSVLLFSVGVLALVGLQANMTKAQSTSKARTDAAYLARELVGTMWSDVTNLAQYESTEASARCAAYTRCSSWQNKVKQELPNADITVSMDPLMVGDVTIEIHWISADGEAHKYTTMTTINASS